MTNVYFYVSNSAENTSGVGVGEVWQAHARGQFIKKNFTLYYGSDRAPRPVRLDPGQYWVEVRLPSDDILKELIEISGESEHEDVVLHLERRSDDRVDAQFFPSFSLPRRSSSASRDSTVRLPGKRLRGPQLGLVLRATTALESATSNHVMMRLPGADNGDSTQSKGRSIQFSLSQITGDFDSWIRYMYAKGESLPPRTKNLAPSWYFERMFERGNATPIQVYPDGSSSLVVNLDEGSSGQWGYRLYGTSQSDARQFVVLEGNRQRSRLIISIPARRDRAELKIAGSDFNGDLPVRISITFEDPESDSLLHFLRNGDGASAMALVSRSEAILHGKFNHPVAAAAAAYVLIQSPPEYLRVPWQEWIGNLGRYFPDVPDGLVLHATLLLQRGDTDGWRHSNHDDFNRYFPEGRSARNELAAELIVEAIRRGPPMFSMGLKLLATNLLLLKQVELHNTPKEILADIESLVTWLSIRVDPAEPFSVFRLDKKYGKTRF